MNNLSVLLYFADVAPKVAGLGMALAIVAIIAALIHLLVVESQEEYSWLSDEKKLRIRAAKENLLSTIRKTYVPYIIVGVFIFSIIPSGSTILLIAGSEAGEAVATSEAGQEILNDVQAAIRAQLRNLAEPTE